MKNALTILALSVALGASACGGVEADNLQDVQLIQSELEAFTARPPFHVHMNEHSRASSTITNPTPYGLPPAKVRAAYGLPATGGTGTIAIIDAYDDPRAEADLNVFSTMYGLPSCTTANGCFTKKTMAARVRADAGWALEISLDIQWAHAIAPNAKILLVEARSASGNDLLAAVDYARSRPDVVAISMSWGGGEFSTEAASDYHFTSPYGATFFTASGDSGYGAEWPAVSPNIVAVGGTTLNFDINGNLTSETAWSGSGGGLSAYEALPAFQSTYGLTYAKRATPDVSANADPASGYSVYDSYGYSGQSGWFRVGGTSGSTPLWAGIRALGTSMPIARLYTDASASYNTFFWDITSGTNGTCGTSCTAAPGYDLVTGLGSPITTTY